MSLKINGSTSGSVTLDAPATGSNVSFTLPGSVGTSGQLLSTDGSGVLSFVNGGLVKITDQSFSAASAVNVNNCFSSTYEAYRVIIKITGASTNLNLTMRMRASGTDNTAANYNTKNVGVNSFNTASNQTAADATSWTIGSVASGIKIYCLTADVVDPVPTTTTYWNGVYQHFSGANNVGNTLALDFYGENSFDGFSIICSTGNIIGSLRVYGYRN